MNLAEEKDFFFLEPEDGIWEELSKDLEELSTSVY